MKKFIMTLIMFIVICLSIWFQMVFLNSIPLIGITANIGIILIAGLGLITGDFIGGITGVVYGLLIDISFGRSIGIYTVLYTICGTLSGKLNKNFSKGNKISMIMIILICTMLFETVVYFFNIILNGFEFSLQVLLTTLILEAIYNILLTIVFFNPIAFLGNLLNKTKNSYYLL